VVALALLTPTYFAYALNAVPVICAVVVWVAPPRAHADDETATAVVATGTAAKRSVTLTQAGDDSRTLPAQSHAAPAWLETLVSRLPLVVDV
jgi:hypothetical protein